MIEVRYRNYRGETAVRAIMPYQVRFGSNEYHPEQQWLLEAIDTERDVVREFALADCDFRMRGTLQDAWEGVRKFHLTFNHPAPEKPRMQTREDIMRRAKWIDSELDELFEAETIAKQADAYLDVIYFALGGLVEIGVEPSAIFDLVQAANMAKLGPDGVPCYDENGKVLKPAGWQSPDPAIEEYVAGLMK